MITGTVPPQQTAGFTLVEILVSMTILSVASLGLGTLLFRAARQAEATSSASYNSAAITQQVSQLQVLPFDALIAGTTCETVADPAFPYESCVTIVNVNSKIKEVTVVITPSGNGMLQPVTSSFRRTISGNGKPLKTQ
jgi:prepilin-type N-terminal cleavage/methylation domain-containing protein